MDLEQKTAKKHGFLGSLRIFASWVGSVFLWFVSPTAASELWEKWLKKK